MTALNRGLRPRAHALAVSGRPPAWHFPASTWRFGASGPLAGWLWQPRQTATWLPGMVPGAEVLHEIAFRAGSREVDDVHLVAALCAEQAGHRIGSAYDSDDQIAGREA